MNALGRQATKLNDAKAFAEPWPKIAIDRITPYLKQHKPKLLTTPEYKDWLEVMPETWRP